MGAHDVWLFSMWFHYFFLVTLFYEAITTDECTQDCLEITYEIYQELSKRSLGKEYVGRSQQRVRV